jgi:hypothetical protein
MEQLQVLESSAHCRRGGMLLWQWRPTTGRRGVKKALHLEHRIERAIQCILESPQPAARSGLRRQRTHTCSLSIAGRFNEAGNEALNVPENGVLGAGRLKGAALSPLQSL